MALIDDLKTELKQRLSAVDPQSGNISDKIADIYAEEIAEYIGLLQYITDAELWQTKFAISDDADTGVVSNEYSSAVIASVGDNRAIGSRAVIMASAYSNISTLYCASILASYSCEIANNYFGAILGSFMSKVSGYGSILSSRSVENATSYSTVWGFGVYGSIPTVNEQTVRIEANGGIGRFSGGTTTGGFDFAEYFESLDGSAIPTGMIVSLSGDRIEPANGSDMLGVVSETAGVIGNSAEFCWNERYLRNEFGGYIYEDIADPDYELQEGETKSDIPLIRVKKENPDYDKDANYVPRNERPEWNVVALLGQIYVKTDGTVDVGNYVKGDNGIGTKSDTPTSLKVMKITKPFDGDYGIAFCILK